MNIRNTFSTEMGTQITHKNEFGVCVVMLLIAMSSSTLLIQSIRIGEVHAQSAPTKVLIAKGSSDQNNGQFFVPPETQITIGGTVNWTNDDNTIHTVTQGEPPSETSSDSEPQFDSGFIQAGTTFEHTFAEPGTVDYYCTLHPWMTGKVTVG